MLTKEFKLLLIGFYRRYRKLCIENSDKHWSNGRDVMNLGSVRGKPAISFKSRFIRKKGKKNFESNLQSFTFTAVAHAINRRDDVWIPRVPSDGVWQRIHRDDKRDRVGQGMPPMEHPALRDTWRLPQSRRLRFQLHQFGFLVPQELLSKPGRERETLVLRFRPCSSMGILQYSHMHKYG